MKTFVSRFPVLTFVVLTLSYQLLIVLFMSFRLTHDIHLADDPMAHMVFRLRVFGPLLFAVVVTYYIEGFGGLKTLFGSYFKWKAPLHLYAFALSWKFMYFYIGAAAVVLLGIGAWPGFAVEDFFGGTHQKAINLRNNMVFIVGVAFVEETAWMKFSFTRLQARYSALAACSLVGLSWGSWYLPMLLLGEGVPDGFPVLMFMLSMYALTILLGWLFNMTRSGSILILAQIVSNCAFFIMPVFPEGSGNPIYANGFIVVSTIVSITLVAVYGWRELGTGKRAMWGESPSPAQQPVGVQPLLTTLGTLK